MDIVEHVKKYCLENRLVKSGDKVLLAVSGGPDSIGLLYIFMKMRGSFNITLSIAHFNHGLRGDESDGDQAFVEQTAQACGIHCYTEKATALKSDRGESPEEAARKFRYSFLYKILDEIGYSCVATGHTLGDNVETILYRMATGSGLPGISGILPRSNRVIHPLLTVTKRQILDFLSEQGLPYRIDRSNFNTAIPRNSIRTEIIPSFQRINSAFERHIATLAGIIREENELLDSFTRQAVDTITSKKTDDVYIFDYTGFLQLDPPTRRRVLIHAFNWLISNEHGMKRRYLSYSVLHRLSSNRVEGNKLLYSNELLTIRKEYNTLIFKKRVVDKRAKGYLYTVNILEGELFIKEIERSIRFDVTGKPEVFKKNSLFFDYHKLQPQLSIRSRREGDRISLRNTGTKKLKNLFIDHKVPVEIRSVVPVLECKGVVIGVFCCLYGMSNRVSAQYMVDEETDTVLACALLHGESCQIPAHPK